MSLEDFRQYSLETHGYKVLKLPGLKRYYQCHVRDGLYTVGEALLDCVSMLWFDDIQALEKMVASSQYKEIVEPDFQNFVTLRYIHTLVTDERWIIGPESR